MCRASFALVKEYMKVALFSKSNRKMIQGSAGDGKVAGSR